MTWAGVPHSWAALTTVSLSDWRSHLEPREALRELGKATEGGSPQDAPSVPWLHSYSIPEQEGPYNTYIGPSACEEAILPVWFRLLAGSPAPDPCRPVGRPLESFVAPSTNALKLLLTAGLHRGEVRGVYVKLLPAAPGRTGGLLDASVGIVASLVDLGGAGRLVVPQAGKRQALCQLLPAKTDDRQKH